MAVAVGPLSPTARWKLSLTALPWASVAVTVIVLLPKSLSVGIPEMTPVWALMLRPAGREAEKVRVSPARSYKMAGDIEREGLAFITALIGDGGCCQAADAGSGIEIRADRMSMCFGRPRRNRLVAEVAAGPGARNTAGIFVHVNGG